MSGPVTRKVRPTWVGDSTTATAGASERADSLLRCRAMPRPTTNRNSHMRAMNPILTRWRARAGNSHRPEHEGGAPESEQVAVDYLGHLGDAFAVEAGAVGG